MTHAGHSDGPARGTGGSGDAPEVLREELESLRRDNLRLRLERESVASANVRAAMRMVELAEQRQAELEAQSHALEAAVKAAENASRQKGDFLARISHELRTPLNGMIGMTTLLLDTQLTVSQREYARTSLESAETLLRLINEILDFSKIEAARLELEAAEFDLWRMVEELVRLLAARAFAKGLEFGAFIAPDVPRMVVGDAVRLRQVLANLLGNALKFTETGGVRVEVRNKGARGERTQLGFEVIDTGCGIPEEALPRLFQSFMQVDNSTTRRFGGTGLGLAISKSLVELMGGHISVHSQIGRGSTFAFDISLSTTLAAALTADLEGRRAALLVAHALHRDLITAHLECAGAAVEAFGGPSELAQALGREPKRFDWIVLEPHDRSSMEERQQLDALRSVAASTTRMLTLVPFDKAWSWSEREGIDRLLTPLWVSEFGPWVRGASRRSPEEPSRRSALGRLRVASAARVLLVEDNQVNQLVGRRLLEKLGCQVVVAEDGVDAIARAEQSRFDLILMDCLMPRMDGYEATRLLRERGFGAPSGTPIIALTAQALPSDRERCIASGMDDYLQKPLDVEALASALSRWVTDAGNPQAPRLAV